jgi:predicted NACHT family NTPase
VALRASSSDWQSSSAKTLDAGHGADDYTPRDSHPEVRRLFCASPEWSRGLPGRLLAQPGRLVLRFDGLDEIFGVQTREAVINDIQRFSSEHAHTPILVTSRVVGYQPPRLRDAEFRQFMLQELDAHQITAFVDGWHAETFDGEEQAVPKRERQKKAIKDSKAIAMLAGNPLLLTMMAILNRNQELPRDRADLYAQASRVLLHQWDTERALVVFPGAACPCGITGEGRNPPSRGFLHAGRTGRFER